MSLTQLVSILHARKRTALSVFGFVLAMALLFSFIMPRQYQASTQVVVDMTPDLVNGGLPPGLSVRPFLKTQAQIVNSERIALMVADRMSLEQDDEYREALARNALPKESSRQFLAEQVLRNLTVTPGSESTFLEISYRARSARTAADIANAFATAYIDTTVEMRTIPAAQRRDWYAVQSRQLRADIDASQKRLGEFQRSKNIVTDDQRQSTGSQRLDALGSAALIAASEANDLIERTRQARTALANNNAESVPQILQSSSIALLKAEQARLRSRYNEQLAVLGKNHPQMRRISSELYSVNARITQESETIVSGMEKARDSATARHDRLQQELIDQKSNVLTEKADREQFALLQRDVQSAQRAYDSVVEQLNKTSLQSVSNYANVFVMSPALPPSKASSPNLLLNTALAVLVGTLMAVGLTVLTEMRSRRVHNRQDLEQATGRPILGSVSTVAGSMATATRQPMTNI